jgi:hypothetical protein
MYSMSVSRNRECTRSATKYHLISNNLFVPGNYFVCRYTKIDPNNPEEVYMIALEEERDGKFKRECNVASFESCAKPSR